eukprot:GHVQ01020494.1.p1 GENE.GHVQ01020494.1~~GHVQ01020494.1.p1  ORF type:complete len:376 (+),score=21.64 GHVQ01020494.1:331-1458(+)
MCCVNSSNIHVLSTVNEDKPTWHQTISGQDLAAIHDVSAPHTAHCLPCGNVLISTMGDAEGSAKGSFLLLDSQTFELRGLWGKENPVVQPFGYDFWYKPPSNIMVATEWAAPKHFRRGFNPADIEKGLYGHSIHFYNWNERRLIKTTDLGRQGLVPLEVRFVHDPWGTDGFVVCAVSSTVFRIYWSDSKQAWLTELVISMDPVKLHGWELPAIPSLPTDCVISLDDRYLYISNWFHGDIRQYDISGKNRARPSLTGQCWIGGMLTKENIVRNKLEIDQPDFVVNDELVVNGTRVYGGPQMMQLSLGMRQLLLIRRPRVFVVIRRQAAVRHHVSVLCLGHAVLPRVEDTRYAYHPSVDACQHNVKLIGYHLQAPFV